MELYDFFKVIGKRKWLIIIIVVIAFAASFASTRASRPPSEARNVLHFNFYLPQEVDVQNDIKRYIVPVEQYAFNFVALFDTESVIRDGLDRAGLEMSTYAVSKIVDASVHVVRVGSEDKHTSFIDIVCKHPNGDVAVALVNGITDAAVERYMEMLTGSVTRNRIFLESQAAEYDVQMRKHEDRLREFLIGNSGFGQTDDDQSIATRKVQLDYSMNNLAADISGMDAKIRMTEKDLEEYRDGEIDYIPPAVKYSKDLDTLQFRLLDLQVERSQLTGRYSDSHPVIKRMDSEIGNANDEMRIEVIRLLEEELEVYYIQRKEKASNLASLGGNLDDLLTAVGEFAIDRIEYNSLLEDLRISQDISGRVKTTLAEAIIEENKVHEQYTVDVVERAETARPRQELWFQPRFRITLSLIGGVFIALVLAFFIEYMSLKGIEVKKVTMKNAGD